MSRAAANKKARHKQNQRHQSNHRPTLVKSQHQDERMASSARQLEHRKNGARSVGELTEVFHVGVIKYGLDAGSAWWRKLFFRLVYLRFVRFAFKYFKIPAADTLHPDGSVSWREDIGVFTSKELADAACQDEFWPVTPLPVNSSLPAASCEYTRQTFPKSSNPDRYGKPVFPLAPPPVEHLDLLQEAAKNLNRAIST